jgi:hypothetical protein
MRTSHKLTRLLLALTSLVVFSALALAQNPPPPMNVAVSDQKAGSVLVFPYYISSTGQVQSDTRISITNTSGLANTVANLARVHIFLMSGANCTPADLFVCLTPNATATFKASEYDPDNAGYVLAVAVDATGFPAQNNVLIGNAFVNDRTEIPGSLYEGNYGAEAFWKKNTTVRNNGDGTAAIRLDDADYDGAPSQFTVEIQHPSDVLNQYIVIAALAGDIANSTLSGCGQVGTGQAYNQDEKFGSFQGFIGNACLCRAIITGTSPRVPGGLAGLIGLAGQGRSGTLKFNVTAGVGLLLTPRLAGGTSNPWSGIRTLHKTAVNTTTAASIIIPTFVPVC